jgi:hypothetical protein
MRASSRTTEAPTFDLKPLSREGIDAALNKAEHYRLLNQPKLAESICLDILEIDPGNQKTLVVLLLALTDQFGLSSSKTAKHALELASTLRDEYSRIYYTGIVHERQGSAALASTTPGSDFDAYEWFREAMQFFEKANTINKGENNDPILRWNTCARIIMESHLRERPDDDVEPLLE